MERGACPCFSPVEALVPLHRRRHQDLVIRPSFSSVSSSSQQRRSAELALFVDAHELFARLVEHPVLRTYRGKERLDHQGSCDGVDDEG